MDKASPIDMRKALVMVDEFKKKGILFVAIPVLNMGKDHTDLIYSVIDRLEKLEKEAEQSS